MGHPRFDRQGKTAANSSGSVMVQTASGYMACAFGREPREGVQKGFEKGGTFSKPLRTGTSLSWSMTPVLCWVRQEAGVTANVVWYAVRRCARQAGIANLAPERYIGSKQKLQDAVNDRFEILVAKYVP